MVGRPRKAGARYANGRLAANVPVITSAIIRHVERAGDFPADRESLAGKVFVYVVESSSCVVKVGYSSDPLSRLKSLQAASHQDLRIEYLVPVERQMATRIERAAHKLLEGKRLHGEWFAVDPTTAYLAIKRALNHALSEGLTRRPN